jgi:hypothetical protein
MNAVDIPDKLEAVHEADRENDGCHLNIYHEHARWCSSAKENPSVVSDLAVACDEKSNAHLAQEIWVNISTGKCRMMTDGDLAVDEWQSCED